MFEMIIANILGILIFLFLFWKRLKDDYSFEKVFNLSFTVLFGFLISMILSSYLASYYWFWIVLVGICSGYAIGILKQKVNFFESFDSLVVGTLPWLGLVFLSDAISKSSLTSFLAFWVSIFLFFLFFFFNSHYRNFSWYKSGRVGFSGLLTAIIFFLIRIITSIFYPNTISFIGKIEIYLSGTVVLLLFLVLYRLSRSKI